MHYVIAFFITALVKLSAAIAPPDDVMETANDEGKQNAVLVTTYFPLCTKISAMQPSTNISISTEDEGT